MTDEQRLREAVEGHVAEHRQANGPGAMAISDADRLARANILAAIVDVLGITEIMREWDELVGPLNELHMNCDCISCRRTRVCQTLWNASKGDDDA